MSPWLSLKLYVTDVTVDFMNPVAKNTCNTEQIPIYCQNFHGKGSSTCENSEKFHGKGWNIRENKHLCTWS